MKQKINLRLTLIALIAILATTIGVTLIYYRTFQKRVRTDLQVNADLLRSSGLFEGENDVSNLEGLAYLQNDHIRITWIRKDGRVLFDNDRDASSMPNHLDRPEVRAALTDGSGESVRNSDTVEMNTYYYAELLDNGTILRVATEARAPYGIITTITPVVLIIMAAILAFCILLGHLLTRQLLDPIENMADHLDDQETPTYKELEPFAEKIRSQHDHLLESVKSRQDFTANISHELKTPLTAISGYAELIENNLIDPGQETHIARQIRNNADRLVTLVNDSIYLSELDHEEQLKPFDQTDLSQIAALCCENAQVMARKKNVSVSCIGTGVTVKGDQELLTELIENLLQNAIQYNHHGGAVKVTTELKNNRPVLTVTDTGIGIPQDKQSYVFERFYRVDKSRSRDSGGTGLGLSIVKHIAQIHGAEISLESTPGKGTSVSVLF